MRDQLAVATASVKDSGAKQLAGAVLMARVSEAVDGRIREQIEAGVFPLRLKPEDWTSGDIAWLLDVIAPTRNSGDTILICRLRSCPMARPGRAVAAGRPRSAA